jgi:hypothetical protein
VDECDADTGVGQVADGIGHRVALSNWTALTRFVDDGRIEAHNNAAERALRGVALGRKNYLHLGSDVGGNSAAVIYTLIGSAKLNGVSHGATRPTSGRAADADQPSTSCCRGRYLQAACPWEMRSRGR